MDFVFRYKLVGFLGLKRLEMVIEGRNSRKTKESNKHLEIWFYSSLKFFFINVKFRIQSVCMSATSLENSWNIPMNLQFFIIVCMLASLVYMLRHWFTCLRHWFTCLRAYLKSYAISSQRTSDKNACYENAILQQIVSFPVDAEIEKKSFESFVHLF